MHVLDYSLDCGIGGRLEKSWARRVREFCKDASTLMGKSQGQLSHNSMFIESLSRVLISVVRGLLTCEMSEGCFPMVNLKITAAVGVPRVEAGVTTDPKSSHAETVCSEASVVPKPTT